MPLNSHQIRFLKAQAHPLKPVVMIGSEGLTENVIKELDSSIEHHELVKVKLNSGEGRKDQAQDAASRVHGELVDVIGNIAIIFRQRKDNSRFILPR